MALIFTVGSEATHFTGVEGMITAVRLYEEARAGYEFTCLLDDGLHTWEVQPCELTMKKKTLGFQSKKKDQ